MAMDMKEIDATDPGQIANLARFIWWKPEIGVEHLQIIGFPGSGKSNLGNGIVATCIDENNDCVILRGDIFAEWRHFTNYKYPIHLMIPEAAKNSIAYINFSLDDLAKDEYFSYSYFNHLDFRIIDHLEPGKILVLYDGAFDLASKGWFWANIFHQLVLRTKLVDHVITFLDNESGNLLPEIALSESERAKSHWKAVNHMCELFVYFRKGLIRPIFISQLEAEINHRIREKCHYKIHKKGVASKQYPRQIQEAAPRQRVDQYIISVGKELYTRHNVSEKFKETKEVWKMVLPFGVEELKFGPEGKETQQSKLLEQRNQLLAVLKDELQWSWTDIAEEVQMTPEGVKKAYKKSKKHN